MYLLSNTIKLLNVLDEYEEFDPASAEDSLFVRTEVNVQINGETKTAYAYLYNRATDSSTKILSGDYLKK